jgi:Hemerythrin HHE cation binding domain
MIQQFRTLLLLTAVCMLGSGCANLGATTPSVPQSVKGEHEELHAGLTRAINAGGETADAARRLERVLHPHFLKEEQYALPPLSLLPGLANGTVGADSPRAKAAIEMSDRLRAEYPQMLKEHAEVGAALERLIAAAGRENKPEVAEWARRLMAHARNEEEVLYPAAMLVGDYLKLKARLPE